jgi:RNA polymerase sigma factor (sigma-70 family)
MQRAGPHKPLTEAQRQLIESHIGLARSEALRFVNQGVIVGHPPDELMAQAFLHLVEAVRSFRPESGTPISAWLRLCLRRGLHRTTRTGGLIRVSHHLRGEKLIEHWHRCRVETGSEVGFDHRPGRELCPLEELVRREEQAERQLDQEDAAFRRGVRAAVGKLPRKRKGRPRKQT